jgi:hypothetical protein
MSMPRHKWDLDREQRRAADSFDDGCGRTIRYCAKCQHRKVTVHPPQGFPWFEFPDDPKWHSQTTPPCSGVPLRSEVRRMVRTAAKASDA